MDVHLEEKPMGWVVVFSVPFGRTVVNLWVSIPANPCFLILLIFSIF